VSTPQVPVRPAERYGDGERPLRTLLGRVAVAVLAAAFVGFVVWAAYARATPDVTWRLLAFDTEAAPGQVRVDFSVRADPKLAVECDVAAQNRDHETVGLRSVAVPAGERSRPVSAVVPVREPAFAAVVETCRVLGR